MISGVMIATLVVAGIGILIGLILGVAAIKLHGIQAILFATKLWCADNSAEMRN